MSIEQQVGDKISAARNLDELAATLEHLLSSGMVMFDGQLIFTRKLVARVQGVRIAINPREHAPPHFHILAPGLNASFTIDSCSLLAGEISANHQRLVEKWFMSARPLLVREWNATRPSDCPVGPIAERGAEAA